MLLFTTKTCPNCAKAKEFLDAEGVEYKVMLAEENKDLARQYGIMQAPTAIILGGDAPQKYVGVEKIKNYVKGN